MSKTGLIIVGFGGPRHLDEVAPMLERIMGTPPPPALLASAIQKYELIGGKSPVVDITQNIAAKLKTSLAESSQTSHISSVEVGMSYTEPFIEDAVARLAADGCSSIIYLSTTAFDSWAAWKGPYLRCTELAAAHGMNQVTLAPTFGLSRHYLDAVQQLIAQKICVASSGVCRITAGNKKLNLSFVAHSLPLDDDREISNDFMQQYNQAVDYLLKGLSNCIGNSEISFVSAGARGGHWLGPALTDEIKEVTASDADTIVVCPLGFATDHMEVLYDLDIVGAQKAKKAGLQFIRIPTLASIDKVNPALISAMMDSIKEVA